MPAQSLDDHCELVADSLGCFRINLGAFIGGFPVHDEDGPLGRVSGVGEQSVGASTSKRAKSDQVAKGSAHFGVGQGVDRSSGSGPSLFG